jgi:RimJ/RimL family protein N-acetyltransferase
MEINLQPILQNDWVLMRPLKEDDFEELYKVASDPLIWEQHPSKTRYQREVFQNYFKGAMESGGAFAVHNSKTGEMIGSTRLYDYDEVNRSILIGYTFIARHCWGSNYNRSMKKLLLDHAFQFVDKVIFHVGENNIRSRKAMEKLGGIFVGSEPRAYYGEAVNVNVIFEITKERWREVGHLAEV